MAEKENSIDGMQNTNNNEKNPIVDNSSNLFLISQTNPETTPVKIPFSDTIALISSESQLHTTLSQIIQNIDITQEETKILGKCIDFCNTKGDKTIPLTLSDFQVLFNMASRPTIYGEAVLSCIDYLIDNIDFEVEGILNVFSEMVEVQGGLEAMYTIKEAS